MITFPDQAASTAPVLTRWPGTGQGHGQQQPYEQVELAWSDVSNNQMPQPETDGQASQNTQSFIARIVGPPQAVNWVRPSSPRVPFGGLFSSTNYHN